VGFRVVGGSTPEGSTVQYYEVSPQFFETMKIRLVRGRVFSGTDHAAAPAVAVVNDAFVREFLGGADPIGQVVQANLTDGNPKLTPDRARQVVGVVGDVRPFFRSDFEPIVYVPYQQHLTDYSGFATFGLHSIKRFVVRTTSSDPTTVAAGVRRVFANGDPAVAVENIQPMRAALATSAGGQAFWMRLLGIFAGLGAFLAAIGIYGVVSYSVEQRTREFGIRATLGAQGADIQRLVLREGMMVTLTGLTLGVAGAFAATRLLQAQLFGVSRMDPATIAVVAFVLLAVSLVACYIPGRRTTKLDPLLALRVE
jgi:putative ABC transport system permease protein